MDAKIYKSFKIMKLIDKFFAIGEIVALFGRADKPAQRQLTCSW